MRKHNGKQLYGIQIIMTTLKIPALKNSPDIYLFSYRGEDPGWFCPDARDLLDRLKLPRLPQKPGRRRGPSELPLPRFSNEQT